MRIAFEGDPSEIVSFFHQFPGSEAFPTETSVLALQPSPEIASLISAFSDSANRIVVHGRHPRTLANEYCRGKRDGLLAAIEMVQAALAGPAMEEQASPPSTVQALAEPAPIAEKPREIVQPTEVRADPVPIKPMGSRTDDGRQPALKDHITNFLEQRGRSRLGEIAKAVGLPNSKLSPRLAELLAGGFIIRHRADNDARGLHTEYDFGRRYSTDGKMGRPPKAAPAPEVQPTPVEPAPVAVVEPIESQAKGSFQPERSKTLKETILNFLIEYGEPASIKDIADYLAFDLQTVRSRLSELNKGSFVERQVLDGGVTYRAIKTWAGEPLPPTEKPAEVPSEQPAASPEPEKPVSPAEPEAERKKRQPNMKLAVTDIIADFGGRVATREIIARMKGVRGKTVSARLAELKHDGFVERHFDPVTRQSEWELLRPYSHEQKLKLSGEVSAVVAPVAVEDQEPEPESEPVVSGPIGEDEDHSNQLRIMAALADHPMSSYYDMERHTGMDRNTLTKRIGDLERMGLVERESHNPVLFVARPPTRKNQRPIPMTSLNDAVISAVREHPGQTSAQLAIRMMKSWSEVARRLHDLEKSVVECRITDKERYYLR